MTNLIWPGQKKWVLTNEDWHPSFTTKGFGNPLNGNAIEVRLMLLHNGLWRVNAWGVGSGLEFDTASYDKANAIWVKITDFTTQQEMLDMGFVQA